MKKEVLVIYNGLGALIDDPDNDRIAVTVAYWAGRRFNMLREGCKERITLHRIFMAVKERDEQDMVLAYEEYTPTAKAHIDLPTAA